VIFFCGDKKKEGVGAICSVILFCGGFSPFCKKYFFKEYSVAKCPVVFLKKIQIFFQKSPQLILI